MTVAFIATIPALAILTVIVTIVAFTARTRYLAGKNIDPQTVKNAREIPMPPYSTQQLMDNYNNLFEQPVVFYAVAIAIVLAGHVDLAYLWMGWIFVALRVIHSLVQCTINHVLTRFSLFILAWLVIAIMSVREMFLLF